jgi:hypothetical protein
VARERRRPPSRRARTAAGGLLPGPRRECTPPVHLPYRNAAPSCIPLTDRRAACRWTRAEAEDGDRLGQAGRQEATRAAAHANDAGCGTSAAPSAYANDASSSRSSTPPTGAASPTSAGLRRVLAARTRIRGGDESAVYQIRKAPPFLELGF